MTLASLSEQRATPGESRAAARLGPAAILGLSAWCGMVAGLLEVAAFVVRKRFLDSNQLLSMSRHFVWLVPITDELLFLIVGLVGAAIAVVGPSPLRRAFVRALAALTLLPMLLAGFPQVYGAAWLLVALGIAMRLVPTLERRGPAFRRFVIATAPLMALVIATTAVLAGWSGGAGRARGTSPTPATGAPNVLLLVMDTVAADHLSLYGYDRPTSRALEELARRGTRFDDVGSAASWTLPSHASLFTGRWPHELSVGWRTPLDASAPTVAGFLADRGYETAGFVANLSYCASDSGLARGFGTYRDYVFNELSPFKTAVLVQKSLDGLQAIADGPGAALDLTWLRAGIRRIRERFEADRKQADVINRELLDWLDARPEPARPFFAFLNYFDAHSPYQLDPRRVHRFGVKPTEEQDDRLILDWWTVDKTRLTPAQLDFARNAYDDCVASLDEQIGRLMDELGRRKILDRTWVIVVADHGESFGEHAGVYLHGSSLYRTEVHVPMVVVPPPGTPIRPVVPETVSLRSLAATIADLAGYSADAPFPGESLTSLWHPSYSGGTEGTAMAELVPNETLDPNGPDPSRRPWPIAALSQGGYSYIRREQGPREELYDFRRDPHEQRDLAGSDAPRIEQLRQTLSRMTAGPLTPDRFNP